MFEKGQGGGGGDKGQKVKMGRRFEEGAQYGRRSLKQRFSKKLRGHPLNGVSSSKEPILGKIPDLIEVRQKGGRGNRPSV